MDYIIFYLLLGLSFGQLIIIAVSFKKNNQLKATIESMRKENERIRKAQADWTQHCKY